MAKAKKIQGRSEEEKGCPQAGQERPRASPPKEERRASRPRKPRANRKKSPKKKAAKKPPRRKRQRASQRAAPRQRRLPSKWIPGHPYPEPKVKRIRTAKGRRPYFFDDPNIDKLLAMIMALTGEVSVIRERLDTHERLAQKKKWPTHQAIEDYKPDDVTEAFRAQWRADYIARILRIVQVELDQITRGETEKDYDKIVEEVSK